MDSPDYKRYLELIKSGNCIEDLLAIYDIAYEKYFKAQKKYKDSELELRKAMYNIICYNRFHDEESDN